MIRKFGLLRDVHDVRDRMYRASPLAPSVPLHVDLREWGGPIKDQGEEGSCTGHAFSSAREWIARKYEKSSPILSPQCLYVEELIADGSFPKDEGAMPRTSCQMLTAKGCCEASLYPYIAGKFTAPTAAQAQNALKYKTGAYHRIGSLPDFLSCLADTTPWPTPALCRRRNRTNSDRAATKCFASVTTSRNNWRSCRTVGATAGDSGDISGCRLR